MTPCICPLHFLVYTFSCHRCASSKRCTTRTWCRAGTARCVVRRLSPFRAHPPDSTEAAQHRPRPAAPTADARRATYNEKAQHTTSRPDAQTYRHAPSNVYTAGHRAAEISTVQLRTTHVASYSAAATSRKPYSHRGTSSGTPHNTATPSPVTYHGNKASTRHAPSKDGALPRFIL